VKNALSEDVVTQLAINATEGAAGTSAINGDIADMAGFDGVRAVLVMGAITATAVTSLKWQQGDASDLSDAEDVAGTGITIADDDDDKVFISDIVRPEKRYVRPVVSRGTANAVVASCVVEKYMAKELPVTQHADVGTLETHFAPVGGTA
jgi:hypothetical protein